MKLTHFSAITWQPTAEGIRGTVHFDNGFGASVIKTSQSNGGSGGFFEVAVIDTENNVMCDTPVMGDVVGWCSPEAVDDLLGKIKEL